MAGFHIHLAIAKRYAEKNNITDTKSLYKGSVDPDLVEDKSISHYSGKQDSTKLIDYLANKVLLYEYLKGHVVDNDYERGVFLHLITDYLFFNDLISKEYLREVAYAEFCKDLYTSYDMTNDYLIKTYDIDFGDLKDVLEDNIKKNKKDKRTENSMGNNILPLPKLDAFIEQVSDINLEDYESKIRESKENLLP